MHRFAQAHSALGFHETGDGAHQIVFGEDLETGVTHFHEDGGIFVAKDVGDALDGSGARHLRQRLAHHFADDELAEIFALQRHGQNLVFVNRADGNVFLEDGNLRNVLVLHGFQRVEYSLIRARDDQFAHFAGLVLGVDHFAGGDFHGGFHVTALAHPLVVVNLAEIAHSGVRQEGHDESFLAEAFCELQRGGNAASAGASGEQAFQLHQTPRDLEALFVIDLDHVVDDFQVHGGGEKIFADAFDHVGLGLHGLATFDEIVVKRAVRIDPNDLDLGIFFFQIFADAADCAARAHAANEVRDFAFAVFPDFRAGGAVMRFRIHGIFVLVGIVGIGNFAREFFRYGVVTTRIIRLDRSGANDHFRAQRLKQIHFFLGLLVGDSENHLVAAHGGDKRETHSRIPGSAFDDGAARLEQAFFLGVIDHGDADAVLHGAAGIDVIGLDVNLRLQALTDAIEAHQRRAADSLEYVVTFHALWSGQAARDKRARRLCHNLYSLACARAA